MMTSHRSRVSIVSCLTAATIFVAGHSAQAATKTWNNAGTTWATAGNWTGGAPTNDLTTDIALFNSTTFTSQPNYSTTSVNGIQVGDGSTLTGPLTLTGTSLSLGSSGITIAANAGTVSLSNAVKLGANQSWANNSSSLFTVGATITNIANVTPFTLTLNGSGSGGTTITGIISNNNSIGTTALTVNTTGGGVTTLSNNNSFSGGTILSGGILRATSNINALGTGTLSLGGGELQLANATGLNFARGTTVTGNTQITSDVLTSGSAGVTHTLSTLSIGTQTLTVAGGSNVSSGTAGVTFNGATTLTGNTTFNVTNPAAGGTTLLNLATTVTGAFSITKTGSGTLSLGGATANTATNLIISGGEVDLGKTAVNAFSGNATVGTGILKLTAGNNIADTATVTINAGGTFALNANSETVSSIALTGSAGSPAILNLGGTAGALKLGTPTLTFGANTQLVGAGSINPVTAANTLTFNFNGGQVSGGTIQLNTGAAITTTVFNITAGMGGGTFLDGSSSANLAGSGMTVNLNQTGTMNLGSTFLANAVASGGTRTILTVNVANTATGMSGGVITGALLADAANVAASLPVNFYNSSLNTLTFASGGSGFNLSGGSLDVRSTTNTSGYGAITTNGNALTISGGTLLGNYLASTTGAITLSSGNLGLRQTAAGTNFTISSTDGSDGRTIKMLSGNTGTFTAASAGTSKIIIGAQSSGGTWDRGTINAGSNYTITADSGGTSPFGSSFASYTIADNSGLNGVVMGANAIPALLTMGTNASFFAASSTAPARTYNVGVTGGSNDIVVAASGNISFGINNTGFAQIINLNRDKGTDTVTLVSNGSLATNAVNIATNQTGAGNLYVLTKNLTLNSGVTFGGTGAISTDLSPNSTNNSTEYPLSNFAGSMAGAGSATAITFNINGTLNGTNTVFLNGLDVGADSAIVIGATGVIGGTQTWATRGTTATGVAFGNSSTTAANWTNGSVSYTHSVTSGTFEASTSSVNPTTASNFRFNSFNLIAGNTQAGAYKLVNNIQNDGGSLKEGFYASNLSFNVGDGSGGRVVFNLNGQDLYTDRFANSYGPSSAGLILQNDAANSVSDIRALGTAGDTLLLPGYQVLNGATLEIVGGNYNTLVSSRSIGNMAADTAAAPNASTGGSQLTLGYNKQTINVGNTNFLGSGNDKGTGTTITGINTNGTFRVVGGTYTTSAYVLNPVGTTGLIDTTAGGVSPVADTTLNNVTIRGGVSLSATADPATDLLTPATTGVYSNGDPVRFTAGTFPGGLAINTIYYVVNLDSNTGKFSVATTPGGTPIDITSTGATVVVGDSSFATNSTVFPALVVAGTTTVNGNLVLANAPGATNQSTLRVGGVNPVGALMVNQSTYTALPLTLTSKGTGYTNGSTVTIAFTRGDGTTGTVTGIATVSNGAIQSIALDLSTATGATLDAATSFGAITGGSGSGASGSGSSLSATPVYLASTTTSNGNLTVTGNLSVTSTNNLAIQSNGTLKVGGNVNIQGVGANQAQLVTGTGVGINAASNFTLNGNKGAGTPQTVAIVPAVGNFHVGDGAGGTLTGTAAQAQLTANLTAATSADINGSTSVLDLNGFNFTVNGSGLTIGGKAIVSGLLTGNTTVNSGGILQLGNGGTAGTIALASTITNNGTFAINRSNAVTQGTDFNGAAISGTGSLMQSGTGTTTLNAANDYSGGTSVAAGTLVLSGSGTFGTGSLTVSGGTADLGGKSIANTLGALTGGGAVNNGTITNNSGTYDLQNGSVGAVLDGSNGVSKTTSATVTLSAANTYTGSTVISAGTLALGASGSIGGSAVIMVQSGATLDVSAVSGGFTLGAQTLGGYGTVNGPVTIGSSGTLSPGNSPGILTFNDAVTLQTGSTTLIEINGSTTRGTDYDGVNFNGGLTVLGGTLTFNISAPIADGTTLNIFDGSTLTASFTSVTATGTGGYGGTFNYNGTSAYTAVFGAQTLTLDLASGDLLFTAAAIPEPSTYAALLAASALAFAALRRRSRKA